MYGVFRLTEGLRDFDDSRGRCYHCGKLIFEDDAWVIPNHMIRAEEIVISHPECDSEYMGRMSQI